MPANNNSDKKPKSFAKTLFSFFAFVKKVFQKKSKGKKEEIAKPQTGQANVDKAINKLEHRGKDLVKQLEQQKQQIEKEAKKTTEKLDRQIEMIKHSERTSIKSLKPIHKFLVRKSKFYYLWHLNPASDKFNITGLMIFAIATLISMLLLYHPLLKRALAAGNTCVWLGTTSTEWDTASNWSNCGGTFPQENDYISFSAAASNDLVMTANKTIAKVEALSGGSFNKTFNTNSHNLTVNGDFTWQKSTLTLGNSKLTIIGNLDITAGTFNYNTSEIVLSGSAANLTTSAGLNFYDLTIDKDAQDTTVTVNTNDFNVSHYLNVKKGKLNGQKISLTVDDARYQIGSSSGGGTTAIEFNTSTSSQYIDGGGGIAQDTVTLNKTAGTVYSNGSATFKNLIQTDGTLNIQGGKLTFPASADGADGKLSCAAGETLTIAGSSGGNLVILRSATPGSQWYFENNCGLTSANYVDVKDSNNTVGTITATNSIDSGNNTNWSFSSPLAVKKWLGGTVGNETNFATADNWDPSGVPASTDIIYFGSNSNYNCDLDQARTIAGFITTDWTKTFDTKNFNLTVNGGFTLGSGTFSAGSATVTIRKDADFSEGIFIANTSRVIFGKIYDDYPTQKVVVGTNNFYDLEHNVSGSGMDCYWLNLNFIGTISVDNNLYLTRGLLNLGTVKVAKNIIVGDSYGLCASDGYNTGRVELNGAPEVTQTISGTGRLPSLIINSSGSVGLANDINISHDWIYLQGTLNINNHKINFSNSATLVGDTGDNFMPGDIAYYDVKFNFSYNGSYWSSFNIIGQATIVNSLILTNGYFRSGIINLRGILEVSSFDGGGGTVILDGTEDQTITSSGGKAPIIAVNKPSGIAKLNGDLAVWGVNNQTGYTGTFDTQNYDLTVNGGFTLGSGTFSAGSADITIKHNADFDGGILNAGSSTFTFSVTADDTYTWTPGSASFYNVVINASENWWDLNISGTATVTNSFSLIKGKIQGGTVDLSGDFIIGSNSGGGTGLVNWTKAGDETWTPEGTAPSIKFNSARTVTLGGELNNYSNASLTIAAGTLDVSTNNYSMTVRGNFNAGNGTFNAREGTLYLGSADFTWTPGSSSYYNVTVQNSANYKDFGVSGSATILNNLNFIRGRWNGGTINVGGNVAIGSETTSKSATAITLSGTSDQTYTIASGGTVPTGTLTINKPSGKAVISGSGTFGGNFDLQQGTLEFDGSNNDTFTFTSGKKITTAAGTILRYVGTDDTHRANLAVTGTGTGDCDSGKFCIEDSGKVYVNWANVANQKNVAGTIYAMNSTDSGGNIGWDFTTTAKTWDGGASTTVWNDANNWNPDGVPDPNDTVTLDTANTITTNADIDFGTLAIGGTVATTLQLTNNIGSGGDLTISSDGTLEQRNMVEQTISGNIVINSEGVLTHSDNSDSELYKLMFKIGGNATINSGGAISADGKGYDLRKGPGGASSGGQGGTYGGRGFNNTKSTYGSFSNPVDLGSGGWAGSGGGAIILTVGSTLTINGPLSADGIEEGSGGSINLMAGLFSGSSNITASGGHCESSSGAGGRIRLDGGSNNNFEGAVIPAGGISDVDGKNGYAGTVYLPSTWTSDLTIGGAGNISSLLLGTDDNASDYTFGNLQIASGGTLQIDGNPILNSNNGGTSIIKADNLIVDEGGSLNAIDLGFASYQGPGSGGSKNAGSYGGQGIKDSTGSTPLTYGSFDNPIYLGSSGKIDKSGGGAIILNINNSLIINGTLSASAKDYPDSWFTGSGGSVKITTPSISGSGSISADGGDCVNASGGGGRIAVILTNSESFGSVNLSAKGGQASPSIGSAGTIYTKIPSQTYGTLKVDNNNQTTSSYYATFYGNGDNCVAGETCQTKTIVLDEIVLANKGKLALVKQQTLNYAHNLTIPTDTELAFIGDTSDPNGKYPTLNLDGNLIVAGSVSSNGLGFPHDQGPGKGSGDTNGGGAGFGGIGGKGVGESSGGGSTYGGPKDVGYIGSGGGKDTAGSGGGHIEINVSGNTEINQPGGTARITSNGNAGTGLGGGGSGGAILLNTTGNLNLGANGEITANGGAGGESGGGGGGGGRILLITKGTRTISGTITASGGAGGGGGESGSAGSIVNQAYPNVPSFSNPSNGAINQSQTLSFTFLTTDVDADWVRYRMQLATNAEFTENLSTFTQGNTVEGQTVTDNGRTAAFSGQSGAGNPAGTGYTSGATATLIISSDTPLVQGQTYYWRLAAMDPEGVDSYGGVERWTDYSSARSFTVASIDKTIFTAGTNQTIRAATDNTCSAVFTFEIRNVINEKVKLLEATDFTLSDGSKGGVFYSDSGCNTVINANILTLNVGDDTGNFYYANTHSATTPYTILVSETPSQGWSDAETLIQVNPGNLDHFGWSGFPTDITADEFFPSAIIVTSYDIQNNIKFDYTGKVWFSTTSSEYDLPYTSYSNSYHFTGLGGDEGDHSFAGNTFRLRKTGTKTVSLHHSAYDGHSQDSLLITSPNINVYPGATHSFFLEDYPASQAPSYPRYAISGLAWDETGGLGSPYEIKVTVRDQFNNTKTDYSGKLWFELYTAGMGETDHSFTYDSEGNAYTFIPGDSGYKIFNSSPYENFYSNTAGNNLIFRLTNGTIQTNYTIYIKPLGLDKFTIETTPTLSKDGTAWDQNIDTQWQGDAGNSSITITAYDVVGNVKVDYGYNEETKEGLIYFYSPERASYAEGVPLTNQEFPYIKTSATDTSQCFQFPIEGSGVYTFTPESSVFKFFKGGRRTVYVSECIDPESSYAQNNLLYDPNFEEADPNKFAVKTGALPVTSPPGQISVVTHIPGSTHENDDHSNNENNNITIGPGDQKLNLSWKNPFDAPMTAEPKIYIYQSVNGTDFSLLESPRPAVNGASQWQSQVITGLNNNQQYWFKLKLGFKRPNGTFILSDFSNVVTGTPKEIAPIDVTAVQLERADPVHPGKVKVDYKLRFDSTVSFDYFNPANLSWNPVSDSAVFGDKGLISGNFENPISHTTYLEMNTDFDGQYLSGSFKLRVNVLVEGQGQSNSESNLLTLDTKNPSSMSLIVDGTGGNTATLTIGAFDNSLPMQMMLSNEPNFQGASWEAYAATKNNYNIQGASTVYIKFRDLYDNVAQTSRDIFATPEVLEVKDASNIVKGDYRLVTIWHAVSGSHHYNIWRTTNGVNYEKIREVTDNGFLNINLDSNKTYGYKVTAEDSLGNISPPAGPVSSQPGSAPDVTADPQVELFGWQQDYGVRAKITWDTDQTADSNVAYSLGELNAGFDMTAKDGAVVKIAGDPKLTYNHEIWLYNLEPSTKYYFKAFSKNEIQIAGYSDVLSFVTPAKIPLVIEGMTISDITMDSALIDWDTSKLSTTLLEYGTSKDTLSFNVEDTNLNTDHTFKLEDLSSGTKYYVRVKATDSDSNVTYSDVYVFDTPAIPVVSGVSVGEASYNTATINWSTNVNCDSNVEFGLGGELKGTQGKADSTTVHSVTLIGLEEKTTYSFRVRSKDQFGNVALGPNMTFTTSSDTEAPKILEIHSEVSSTGSGENVKYQAVISWETNEPATSQVEFAPGISGDYTEKTREDVSLNSTHVVIIPDLKPNSAYHFRVVSKDKAGNTAYSDDASLITPPKEKSLFQIIIKTLEETFSWVGRLREKWFGNK